MHLTTKKKIIKDLSTFLQGFFEGEKMNKCVVVLYFTVRVYEIYCLTENAQ